MGGLSSVVELVFGRLCAALGSVLYAAGEKSKRNPRVKLLSSSEKCH